MERRQFARIKVNMQLKFKTLEFIEGLIEGAALDLSIGGMFVRADEIKPVGTAVEIELPIPGGAPAIVRGIVRSVQYKNGAPIGMGIEFEELVDPALGVIQYLVNKNLASDA